LKKIKPDLIYFDSNKTMTDIDVAFKLFPDAILSGDDWTWKKDDVYPVRNAVERFSENNGFNIKVKKATWLLTSLQSEVQHPPFRVSG